MKINNKSKFIKTSILEFLKEQKINEGTDFDDLFLGKTIAEIRPLVPSLLNDSISGMSDKKIVAMDSFETEQDAVSMLESNGWSVGRMQGDSPRGIMSSKYDIMKWRNLSTEDKNILEGVLVKLENMYYILYFTFPNF